MAALCALTVAAGCATVPRPAIETGPWTLQAPDSAIESVEVRALRPGEYYVSAAGHPVAGVYMLHRDRFEMVKPDNPRMAGIVWIVNSPRSMTLVEEPPVQMSGRRLVSAQMTKRE